MSTSRSTARDHRCREIQIEVSVPEGSAIVQRYDLVTRESMSGHGAPEVSRSDGVSDFYRFDTLVYNYEPRREFVVGLNTGRSAVFSVPNGAAGTAEFSAWAAPTYLAQADNVSWRVMRGDATVRLSGNAPVRLRYRFVHSGICGQ